jgi:hypothetical protein
MYSPQVWATVLAKAKRQAIVEATKIPKTKVNAEDSNERVVHSCQFDSERMAAAEAQVEQLTDGFNTLTQALSDMNEELAKAQGMLKFCYAICQNPAIKDLADSQRSSARGALGSLSFGTRGGFNRPGAPNGGGHNAGRGSWRPTP